MSESMKGTVRINYSKYYKYFTSAGTSLFIMSYLAVFGYLTATFSFTGESNISHVAFLLLPALAGVLMGSYGLCIWKKHHEREDEYREEELRQQRAVASIAESQAELQEERAERIGQDSISIGGFDIAMEDWSET
jgi:hypothetical protein